MITTKESLDTALTEHLNKLTTFGTADQIALHYQDQHIQAACHNAFRCVVAQDLQIALTEKLGKDVTVCVSYGQTSVWTESGVAVVRGHSPVIREFIERFDHSEYPALVARAEAA